MTQDNTLPDIDSHNEEVKKPNKGQIVAVITVIILIFIVIIAGGLYTVLTAEDDLPHAPANILDTFGTSDLSETGAKDYEISVPGKQEASEPEQLTSEGSVNGITDFSISLDSSQTPVANSASPDNPELIPQPSKDRAEASSDKVKKIEANIQELNNSLNYLSEDIASLKVKLDSLLAKSSTSDNSPEAYLKLEKRLDKAERSLRTVIKSQKSKKKIGTNSKHKKLTAVKPNTPPFRFIGVEIWDGEQKAILEANNSITQLSIGESSSGWVLTNLVYPDRAEFKNRKSGKDIVLKSDGRAPHDH